MGSNAVSTLLGTNVDVIATSPQLGIVYPETDVVSTFNQVYAARLYARGLSALELASSGRISMSPYDRFALDVTHGDSLLGGSNVNSTGSNAVILRAADTACELSLAGPGEQSSVSLTADGNVFIQSACNVYIRGQNLVLDISNLQTTYLFVVNGRGELELQQNTPSSHRTVARFGCRTL